MIKRICYVMLILLVLFLFSCTDNEQNDVTKTKTTESIVTTEMSEPSTTALPATTEPFVETSAPDTTEVTTSLPEPPETTNYEIPDEPKNNLAAAISYEAFLNLLNDGECSLAVAYLGCFDGSYEDAMTYLEQLQMFVHQPFLREISEYEFIDMDGIELYAIVPLANTNLSVYEAVLDENDFSLKTGKEYYSSNKAKAILVSGNISETIPNFIICYQDSNGEAIEYSPFLSGITQNLEFVEGILDFSPYADIDEYILTSEFIFCGEWITDAYNDSGEQCLIDLSLALDGTVTYAYSVADSEEPSFLFGEWTLDENNVLTINLVGEDEDLYSLSFEWATLGDTLLLKPLSGDEIIFERYVAPVVNEEEITGCYSTVSEDKVVYLELSWDQSAIFTVEDYPNILEKYKGAWCVENGYLYLSLTLEGGTDYSSEEPEKFIKGCYYIDTDTEADLKLFHVYGDAFTFEMENSLQDEFSYYQHV